MEFPSNDLFLCELAAKSPIAFVASRDEVVFLEGINRMKMNKEKATEIALGVLTFALWIGTAILGFYVAVSIQEMVFRFYVFCCADNSWGFTVTKQWSSIVLMLIWVSFIVWIGDYQSKHFNEPKSWKIYGWTYLVMVVLLGISWLI